MFKVQRSVGRVHTYIHTHAHSYTYKTHTRKTKEENKTVAAETKLELFSTVTET